MFEVLDSMKNGKFYNGVTEKFGITVNNVDYIVKLDDNYSPICEYVASAFIRSIGIACHEVRLGVYNGRIVSIAKDFTSGTSLTLHPYKDMKQSSEDTDIGNKEYTYKDVQYLISKHLKMSPRNRELAIKGFWDMFICDAIVANRDRHWGNWGYLSNGQEYILAPLYDNGSSLFPDIGGKLAEYADRVQRKEFIKVRTFQFPASLFMMQRKDGSIKRTNYYEMFSDLRINKVFASEVNAIRISYGYMDVFNRMYDICCSIDIDNVLRRFYIEIVTIRYMVIVARMNFDKAYGIIERELNNG